MENLKRELRAGDTVAVLGLAYKPHSHVLDDSQGLALAHALAQTGVRVIAYDPLSVAMQVDALRKPGVNGWLLQGSLQQCLDEADMVLITTPDPAFKALNSSNFARVKFSVTVVDFWRILQQELGGHEPRIRYIPVGHSLCDEQNKARLRDLWETSTGAPIHGNSVSIGAD